ncbi:hypothetical protein, unknown function [Leishmania tarentolae]|uniref:Uncharacterized protein n=1 Tax=Leishmania tarentolae TaxID=5689 RepID=A0A640KH45_LEITA|nr:hypothetical protein, unknown function [Leishmania tarentolae]
MSKHTDINADLDPMPSADLAPRWMLGDTHLMTNPMKVAASSVRGLFSTQRASSRDVEPYQVCQSYVDQLLKLQGEQMSLAQSLKAALHVAPTHATAVFGSDNIDPAPQRASAVDPVLENTENVAPDCRRCGSSSLCHQRLTNDGAEACSQLTPSPSQALLLVSSVTSLVHRLHVLQRESAEFAATRCLPALGELLATFEAYWVWKRSSMCDDSAQEEEAVSSTPVTADLASTNRAMTGSRTASQVTSNQPSQQRRPPTLRQRYDHALCVRDELLSFLQLHAEAVRALDAQLEQWCHCRNSEPAERSANGGLTASPIGTSDVSVIVPHEVTHAQAQRREFEAYVSQLVEVAQTTHHMTHLLQVALRALCRPSSRTSRPSLTPRPDAAEEKDSLSSALKQPRQMEETAAHSAGMAGLRCGRLQTRFSVNTGGLTNRRINAKCATMYSSTEGVGRPASSPAANASGTVERPKCVHRSPSTPNSRTLKGCATPTPCDDSRSVHATGGDAQGSWVDTLSPLTPPPTAATASASPASSSPVCIEHNGSHGQPQRQRHGRHRPSLLPSSPGAAARAGDRASLDAASPSSSPYAAPATASDVSLSPLTVQGAAATTVVSVASQQPREGSADREQRYPVPMPFFASPRGGSGDAEEDNDVQAAVTPVVTMRLAAEGSVTHNFDSDAASGLSVAAEQPPCPRRYRFSQDGGRSLLRELTSASVDAATGAGEQLSTNLQRDARRRRHVPDVPTCADKTRESSAEVAVDAQGATAVFVPPPSEQLANHPGHASVTRTTLAAAATPASAHLSSPRSLSMDGSAGRRITSSEGDEQGLPGMVHVDAIPKSRWLRLHHPATSQSYSSAAPALASADDAGGAQLAQNTTALVHPPHHSSSHEAENDGDTASICSASRPADPNFYTPCASSTGVLPPPALSATFHGLTSSAAPEPLPTPLEQTQYPEEQQGQQAHPTQEWDRTFSPTPLLLDNLEEELDEVQQRLQAPAPPLHSAPAFSESSAASANNTTPWPQRCSLEDRMMLTMREELKALRAEQRHSLHKMQKYIKHTLEEVVEATSTVSSRHHGSRGSSCASSRSQHCGTRLENSNHADASIGEVRLTVATERQKHASRASAQPHGDAPAKSNEAAGEAASLKRSSNSAALPSRPSSTQAQRHTAHTAPASPPSTTEELQRSLAVAEARAAQLEQLTGQLKKRLWMAERSRRPPTAETPRGRKLTGAATQRLSLRDAFAYSLSYDTGDAGDDDGSWPNNCKATASMGYADEDAAAAADNEAPEELGMLHLVDREPGCGTLSDARTHSPPRLSTLRHTPSDAWHSSRRVSYDGSRSSSTEHERSSNVRCLEDDTATHLGPSLTSMALAGIARGYSDSRLYSGAAAPVSATSSRTATRSLGILQKRASIFQVLRQNQAAWGAQSSAPTGHTPPHQQQSEASRLPPPPPLQHCSAGTATEVTAELTTSVHSTASSSSPCETQQPLSHPYNADAASSRYGVHAGRGAAAGFLRPSVSPHYYSAISDGSDTGYVSGAGLESYLSTSALRAEQVLQNAKRLLQSRTASLAAGNRSIGHDSGISAPLSRGLQLPSTAVSSPKTWGNTRDHRSQMPYHHGAGMTGERSAAQVGCLRHPGQGNDCMEQLDHTTPPSHAFVFPAPSPAMEDTASTLQRVSGSLDRGTANNSAADGGHGPRSHPSSPESVYHGYDTSPCSAVAYSTSRVPRPSSPSAAKVALNSTQQRCTPPSTAVDLPLLVGVSDAATRATPARQAQRRVDSATSPISLEDAEVRERACKRERSTCIHSDVGVRHREGSARTMTASMERDCSPPSVCTTDTHSTPGYRSSSSPLPVAEEQRVHGSRQQALGPLTSLVGHSTSGRTSCSTSSTLSCGSAQQQLLETLERQESTLAATLNHLQEQQQQLREKHRQVSLLANRTALGAPAHASARMPRGNHQLTARATAAPAASATSRKKSRRTFSKDYCGSGATTGTSDTSTDVDHLLERFAAAAISLAEREQRVRKTLRAVQRQRSALLRDDLL